MEKTHLFLLFLLPIIVTAAPTPSPASAALPPSPPSSSPSPPLPTPTRPSPLLDLDLPHPSRQQLNNIIDALIGAGDFESWVDFLSSSKPTSFPLSATFFVPADASRPPAATAASDPFLFAYHIVPQRLSFSELLQFKSFSRLPTLLDGNSIVITNNSRSNFTLDGSLLSHPDLYANPAISVHGVSILLDYSVYGVDARRKRRPPPPPMNISQPPGRSIGLPPPVTVVYAPGDHPQGSDAACFCSEVWGFLAVVCAVLALRIHRVGPHR